MHKEEAEWIESQLGALSKTDLSPFLNIGSSTEEFRVSLQPYIDELIFRPLRRADVDVVHQDIKAAPGVDLIGDLTDRGFLGRLQNMQFRVVLCSNLFEHIVNRQEIADAMLQVIPVGGYLLVTVPSRYPKHMDPIDTMFRPTVDELAAMFHGTQMIDSALIDVGTAWSILSKKPKQLIKLFARVMLPFYKPDGWITAINEMLWMFKRRAIACVLLKKTL